MTIDELMNQLQEEETALKHIMENVERHITGEEAQERMKARYNGKLDLIDDIKTLINQ